MLLTSLWVSLTSLLVNCVTVPNFLACANLGNSGYCRTFVSHDTVNIDNGSNPYNDGTNILTWEEVERTGITIPTDQFVLLKDFFDNYCHQNSSNCTGGIGTWNVIVSDLNEKRIQGIKNMTPVPPEDKEPPKPKRKPKH